MRKAASISASSCSRSVPSMLARSSAMVSNSLAERASSSSTSGSTFSWISRTVISTFEVEPSPSGNAICFVSPAFAPESASSISGASLPPPSSTTVSGCASPSASTRSTRSVSPGCAGRSPAGASSATDSRSASISASTDSCGTSTWARGTSSWVQSASSGSGCTSTVATNVHAVSAVSGSSNSYCGSETGRTRLRDAALQNQPPM
jgi:hypothetical protein